LIKNNKVTVIIPSFAQNDLLKRCLDSLRLQSFKNFNVLIVDDASKNDLSSFVNGYKDLYLEVKYNNENLGAFDNMFACIYLPVTSEYKMVFHEDDIMHPQLIGALVEVLENDEKLFAAGTIMKIFRDNYYLEETDYTIQKLNTNIYVEKSELIYDLLKDTHLCFGSIMYRENVISKLKKPDIVNYYTLADRPFIINNMANNNFAIIKNQFVFYNEHYIDDTRASKLTRENLLNLFCFYKFETNNLPFKKRKYISSIITKQILVCYDRFEKKRKIDFLFYLLKAFQKRVISSKYFFYHYFINK
jgi:glycosyltransferase involved in cell wall biosynthesis